MSSSHSGPVADRRTVLRTAAWSVPVIAMAAPIPAFAASPCEPYVFDFTTVNVGTTYSNGSVINSVRGTSIVLSLSGATNGTGSGGSPSNASVFQTTTTTRELRFYDANTVGTSQTIGISFVLTGTSTPTTVKNLTITYVDIDASTNYSDNLVVNTAGFSGAVGASVTGAGTSASPYRSSTGTSVGDGSTAGNVALTYTATNTVSVTYAQGGTVVNGFPHIGIRTIAFTPQTC